MFHFKQNISQRKLSKELGLSRATIKKAFALDESIKISTYRDIARFFGKSLELIGHPSSHSPDNSTVATQLRIERDGERSWKIHLMNMVDEIRRTGDMRLFVLPPTSSTLIGPKVPALIAATVLELCRELEYPSPDWALRHPPLKSAWFVSGVEALKASAILESPYTFRSKNIFVLENFLQRA